MDGQDMTGPLDEFGVWAWFWQIFWPLRGWKYITACLVGSRKRILFRLGADRFYGQTREKSKAKSNSSDQGWELRRVVDGVLLGSI